MTTIHQPHEFTSSKYGANADYSTINAIAYAAVPALQKKSPEEDELQLKSAGSNNAAGEESQRKDNDIPLNANHTGMPDQLKSGIENLSGYFMDDVRVHYNSARPAQLNALAYAQGTDIHVAPGQERHLPHEAWHVVQQKQGRVRPTMQMKGGVNVNDDKGLEHEADVMGERAVEINGNEPSLKFMANPTEIITQKKPQEVDNKSQKTVSLRAFQNIGHSLLPIQTAIKHPVAYNSSRQQRTIQLKKNTRPTDKDLVDLIGKGVERKVVDGKTTDSERGDAIWAKVNEEYNTCKGNGAKYWAALVAKAAEYKDIDKKGGLVSELNKKRTENATRYEENYSSTIEKLPSTEYRVSTEGYDPTTDSKPVVTAGQYEGDYSNVFNLATGVIKAAWNFAEHDKARNANKGINNSEILYRQFKDVAEEHYKFDGDKANKVKNSVKSISKIIRDTIINDTTLAVIYMAYPDNKKPKDEKKTWATDTEEFKSLLGTPNAKSTPFLLMDHLDEMEKTIDNIETEDNNLDINLKSI